MFGMTEEGRIKIGQCLVHEGMLGRFLKSLQKWQFGEMLTIVFAFQQIS